MWNTRTAYPMSFIRGWGIRPDPSGHYYAWVSGMSPGGFTDDPEMDALYNEANSLAEPAAHDTALKKLYRYLQDKAYVINLFALVDNNAIGKRVDWQYAPGLPSRLDLVTWR
jgi:ABC-type transport system substrate-binding protein